MGCDTTGAASEPTMTYANNLSLSSLILLATLSLAAPGCTIVQPGGDDDGTADTGSTSQTSAETGEPTGGDPGNGEVPPETLPPPPDVASEGLHIALTGDDASG
jgi:hypothetical protein